MISLSPLPIARSVRRGDERSRIASSAYRSRGTLTRRGALRGAGLGAAGRAGVALVGCGGDDGDGDGGGVGTAAPNGGGTTASSSATGVHCMRNRTVRAGGKPHGV